MAGAQDCNSTAGAILPQKISRQLGNPPGVPYLLQLGDGSTLTLHLPHRRGQFPHHQAKEGKTSYQMTEFQDLACASASLFLPARNWTSIVELDRAPCSLLIRLHSIMAGCRRAHLAGVIKVATLFRQLQTDVGQQPQSENYCQQLVATMSQAS